VGLFGLAMAAAAAALFARTVANYHGALDTNLRVPWLVLAIAFVLAESCALHLQFRGNSQTFTPDEVLIVIGLFALSPSLLLGAYLLGGAIALGVIRRIKLFKLIFNLSQWALSCTVAIAVFRALASPGQPLGAHNWIAALVATIAAALVSITAITVAITILEGRPTANATGRNVVFGLFGTAVDGVLGLGAVILLAESPLNLLLLAGPIAIVLVSTALWAGTFTRNREYASALILAQTAVERHPTAVAHHLLAEELDREQIEHACGLVTFAANYWDTELQKGFGGNVSVSEDAETAALPGSDDDAGGYL
jgi:hypothetical protein